MSDYCNKFCRVNVVIKFELYGSFGMSVHKFSKGFVIQVGVCESARRCMSPHEWWMTPQEGV